MNSARGLGLVVLVQRRVPRMRGRQSAQFMAHNTVNRTHLQETWETVDEALTTIDYTFASGLNRVVDLEAALRARLPFGVDVGLLSTRARNLLIGAVVNGIPAFVD